MNCIDLSESSPQTFGSPADQCSFLLSLPLYFSLSDPLFHPVLLFLLPVLRRSFRPACSSSPAWLDVLGPDKSLFLLHPVGKKEVLLILLVPREPFCLCGQRDMEAKRLRKLKTFMGLRGSRFGKQFQNGLT